MWNLDKKHSTIKFEIEAMALTERFINYTKFDTQSAEDSQTVPSTPKQLVFAKYLKEELEREGLKDVDIAHLVHLDIAQTLVLELFFQVAGKV